MKSIATINFKGGVGKTTITWLLAKYAAEVRNKKVLVVDTDAQMSLTLAVQLHEETGAMVAEFEKWMIQHRAKKRTLLNALEKYDTAHGGHFDFPIDGAVVYPMSENLHFIPSTEELYWLEMEVFDKMKVRHFIRALLGKIEHSKSYQYNYVFFDCPPNFTALSFSVLSCVSLILVPINPDVFASRGIDLMMEGLRLRIEPWPNPSVGVFMNKAKFRSGNLTRETAGYWNDAKLVCQHKAVQGMHITPYDAFIPDRVSIKRAIPGRYFPDEFESSFATLWDNIERTFQ